MRVRRRVTRLALGLSLLLALSTAVVIQAAPPAQEPGPAVDRVFFKAFNVDRAPLDLQQGNMDLYIFGLKTAAAAELRASTDIAIYQAPATTLSLILNPAPAPKGELNPFALQDVRWAMQLLVNREFVAGEIYRGMATPMLSHLSPSDFDQVTVHDLIRERNIRYDPELARSMIKDAMEGAGAVMQDGVWHFGGQPVRIKFIIRIEDERREVGDLVRAELEQAGFLVAPLYQQFAPAILSVYSTDPRAFEWHVYTEGWGRSSPDRYDFSLINQMAAPWLGNMPGWREAGFWQHENADIDEIGKRIFTGQFASQAERDTLYRQATGMALDDSVRVWIATVTNSFGANAALEGVTEDLVAGPRSPWTLREATVPGQNELTVGNLWVWTERTTWNPVAGMGDVYSVDIWRNLNDPPIWNHPFSGVPMPVRVGYDIETAGPTGTLDVPSDAVMLEPESDTWKRVGVGAEATSMVTFDYSKYFISNWHHGRPITMADVIYSIYQSFDIAYDPEKSRVELALATTSRPFLDTFRGFRVLDENRLEVYVDFWHFEEKYIASYANPSSVSMPWEVLAAMDSLVFEQRQAAYSDTAAGRYNVPWISLVMDRDARLVKNTILGFQRSGSVPESVFDIGGESLTSQGEADARYQAVLDWFSEYGLLVISNGPFKLTRYDPPAQFAELQAYRDPSYPFEPGDWRFGVPELVEIAQVPSGAIQIGAENALGVTLEGPGSLGVRYVLFDPADGTVIASGAATEGVAGEFTVELGEDVGDALQPGLYQLFLTAYSDAVSAVTERRIDLEASVAAPTPQVEATATPASGLVATPTPTTPDEQPTVVATAEAEEENGGGCGRGVATEIAFPLAALALVGLVWRRRGVGR